MRSYIETRRGKNNHPDNDCKNKQPHFLSTIEYSPYFACDNCDTAWVSKIKYVREAGKYQYSALEK